MVVTLRRSSMALALCALAASCALPPVDARPVIDEQGAQRELKLAIAAAPYPLRLPAALPDGFALAHAEWVDEPNDPVRHGFSFDARYLGPDNVVVHIFQTNVSMVGEADPVTIPGATTISVAGGNWSSVTLPNGDGSFNTQVARRFDGTALSELITVSIDAPNAELAILAAGSLAEVAP